MVSNEKEIPQDKKHQDEGKRREEGCAPLTPAKFKVFSGGESGEERKLLR
jgi:hypothetical protein